MNRERGNRIWFMMTWPDGIPGGYVNAALGTPEAATSAVPPEASISSTARFWTATPVLAE